MATFCCHYTPLNPFRYHIYFVPHVGLKLSLHGDFNNMLIYIMHLYIPVVLGIIVFWLSYLVYIMLSVLLKEYYLFITIW